MMSMLVQIIPMMVHVSGHDHNELLCSDNAHAALFDYQFRPTMFCLASIMPFMRCFSSGDAHDDFMRDHMTPIMIVFIMQCPSCVVVCQNMAIKLGCSSTVDDDA